MHCKNFFTAFTILASTSFGSALPHEESSPTAPAHITSIAGRHNCSKTAMIHWPKGTGMPHPPGCQRPTCMPHPPGCQCPTCVPPKAPHPTVTPSIASQHNCSDTTTFHQVKVTGTPHPPGCQCPICMPPKAYPIFIPHRNVTSRNNTALAPSFTWPASRNHTHVAAKSIKPPIAPKSVHGNTALAIGIAGAAMGIVLVFTGVYVWLKKRGKGKNVGDETGDGHGDRVRASRNGEGWEVGKV